LASTAREGARPSEVGGHADRLGLDFIDQEQISPQYRAFIMA